MKKYLLVIALLFAGTMMAQNQQTAAPLKIGYVDSQVILTSLPEAIKAQGDLDALTKKWTSQIDSMSQVLQSEYAAYQKQAANMPEAKRNAAQQELIKKQQDVEDFRREKFAQQTGEIYKKNEEIFSPIKDKIYTAINDVAKREGMQFVFDKTGDVLLLYADSSFDITYLVLDSLKKGKK